VSIRLRTVLFALIALVAVGSIWSAWSQAEPTVSPKKSAAPATFIDGACNATAQGVTEIIDFGDGAEPLAYCAQDFFGTGWELLNQRVAVQGTADYPTGFVCRIEDVPSAEVQDCANTPTYDEGSWAYFVADEESAGWVLSGTGSSMRNPACGTSEAWVFTSGKNIEQQKPSVEPVIDSCSTD
jgi:hypothetical protein